MPYRCITSSPEGLVQQVAVCYLRHGYWWYVTGRIPDGKDPTSVDRKLIAKYGIDLIGSLSYLGHPLAAYDAAKTGVPPLALLPPFGGTF